MQLFFFLHRILSFLGYSCVTRKHVFYIIISSIASAAKPQKVGSRCRSMYCNPWLLPQL